jgi:Protein of unknown function (DUF2752)
VSQSARNLFQTEIVTGSLFTRIAAGVVGVLLVTVLGIARWLTPSETGYGTHTQLGLPPCVMKEFLRIPCPSCGMTTSFACTMDGDLRRAIVANPAGPPAVLLVMLGIVWCGMAVVTGRIVFGRAAILVWSGLISAEGLVLTVVWLIRIL